MVDSSAIARVGRDRKISRVVLKFVLVVFAGNRVSEKVLLKQNSALCASAILRLVLGRGRVSVCHLFWEDNFGKKYESMKQDELRC